MATENKESRDSSLQYQTGFAAELATEALPGALPRGQNSPQKPPYGLYTEQLSGTAFTAPRHLNRRTWLYKIRPSVMHGRFRPRPAGLLQSAPFDLSQVSPDRLRWDPIPMPTDPTDFIDGLVTIGGNGNVALQAGMAIHLYAANQSMYDRFFYDADGELLVVPQLGRLRVRSEMGILDVGPGEFALLPRGVRFAIELHDGEARGYVCENYGACFRLPELGPIGANGLANARDFLTPVAAFEDKEGQFELIAKFGGNLWVADIAHSPCDVVAWHGNYAPCKYDLALFNTIYSVSFDHPDPSIFTVLTSPTYTPGTANVDFVIFPPRWMVAEHSFRLPWFHRNVMSEYMGLIHGVYDAKAEGFLPGGGSLHNCMSAHGPDAVSCERASESELKPQRVENTLAFMFESRYPILPTQHAMHLPQLQADYQDCWQSLQKKFTGQP